MYILFVRLENGRNKIKQIQWYETVNQLNLNFKKMSMQVTSEYVWYVFCHN